MRCLLLISWLLFVCSVAAQQKYKGDLLKEGYIGIHGGVAIPFGVFGLADNDADKSSGYAKTGYTLNASFRYAITQTIGIGLHYFFTSTPFDSKKLQEYLNTKYAPLTYTYHSDPWTIQGIMLAPEYRFNADRFSIDLSAGIGLLTAQLPENTFTETRPSNIANTYIQPSSNAFALGYSFGLGVRYRVYKNFILLVQGDVLFSDPTFSDLNIQSQSGGFLNPLPDYKQPFRIIHASAGIGYQFD